MLKQKRIDNGQLGGIINTIAGSSYVFGFVNYIQTAALLYFAKLNEYMSIYTFAVISLTGLILWFGYNYIFVQPSQVRFIQNQAWEHGSPIRTCFEEQKKMLERIERKLDERP